MYSKMWAASGLAYPALLDRLITLARERHAEKQQIRTSADMSSRSRLLPAVALLLAAVVRHLLLRQASPRLNGLVKAYDLILDGALRRSGAAAENGVPARAASGLRRHRRRERLLASDAESGRHQPRCGAARAHQRRHRRRRSMGGARAEAGGGVVLSRRRVRHARAAAGAPRAISGGRARRQAHPRFAAARDLAGSHDRRRVFRPWACITTTRRSRRAAARILSMLMFLPGRRSRRRAERDGADAQQGVAAAR